MKMIFKNLAKYEIADPCQWTVQENNKPNIKQPSASFWTEIMICTVLLQIESMEELIIGPHVGSLYKK